MKLFGNTEPNIELIAITTPTNIISNTDPRSVIECIPAIAAGTSYEKEATTIEKATILNKKLIQLQHEVPLEALQINFKLTGISKITGAQISRHRVGGSHVSLSRRYTKQKPGFVFPGLSYITKKEDAKEIYTALSLSFESAMKEYNHLLDEGCRKADARYLIPASTATTRNMWMNIRALRHFLKLRLAPDSEWEIRRLSYMLLELVYNLTPSLFEDIIEKYLPELKKSS